MTDEQVKQVNQQRLSGVKPILAEAAAWMIEAARQRGNILVVAEGFRSVQTQNDYYAQGRTKPGKIITHLKGGKSKHNFGEAVDFDFVVNGIQSNDLGNNWNLIGELSAKVGLVWGGNWKTLKDYRHIEMPSNYKLPNLPSILPSNYTLPNNLLESSSFEQPDEPETISTGVILIGVLILVLLID